MQRGILKKAEQTKLNNKVTFKATGPLWDLLPLVWCLSGKPD